MREVDVDVRSWKLVGETKNSRFFDVREGILGAVPRPGALDDKETAEENNAFQGGYFEKLGKRGVVIVWLDAFASQDKDARRVYQESDHPWIRGVALVASSLLGRAIASFSTGIRKPKLPLKFVATTAEALAWADALDERET
jgi:hypothetical protein